jgi:hypothetical protein
VDDRVNGLVDGGSVRMNGFGDNGVGGYGPVVGLWGSRFAACESFAVFVGSEYGFPESELHGEDIDWQRRFRGTLSDPD